MDVVVHDEKGDAEPVLILADRNADGHISVLDSLSGPLAEAGSADEVYGMVRDAVNSALSGGPCRRLAVDLSADCTPTPRLPPGMPEPGSTGGRNPARRVVQRLTHGLCLTDVGEGGRYWPSRSSHSRTGLPRLMMPISMSM